MAVDEAILEATQQHQQCTLRFYQWCEPTLSLGYFQPYAERKTHADSRTCPLVRRSTGGGAIVHDIELTYSFACPIARGFGSNTEELYQVFHKNLIKVLSAEFGVTAAMCQTRASEQAEPPFLCFKRRSFGDILICDHKVTGSAQRRRRSAVLQHGSVLLGTSSKATELPGIREITQVDLQPNDLVEPWARAVGNELNLRWSESVFSERDHDVARKTERLRFASQSWTRKR